MALLEVIEDEPHAKRLVLRAPPWPWHVRVRRMLATIAAVGVSLAWVGALFVPPVDWGLLGVFLVVGVGVGLWITKLPPEEVEEICADGATRRLAVRLRGHRIWGRRQREWTDGAVLQVASLGLSPEGPARPELGVELVHKEKGRRERLGLTGIRGVDRRDEVELLVHAWAEALGQRVAQVQDGLLVRIWEIGASGEPPRPRRDLGSFGYRDAAGPSTLDLARAPGFEGSPKELAESALASTGELRGAVEKGDDRLVVRGERPLGFVVVLALTSIVTGVVGARGAGDAWMVGVVVGAAVPSVSALLVFAFGFVFRAGTVLPWRALLWLLGREFPVVPRSPTFAVGAGFALEGAELRAGLWRRRVGRSPESSLFLIDRHQSWVHDRRERHHCAWRELWLYEAGRWRLLVRSKEVPRRRPGPTVALFELTRILGSRLNLPIRFALV